MIGTTWRVLRWTGLGTVALGLVLSSATLRAQGPNERPAEVKKNVEDPSTRNPNAKVWTLNFTFKEPRLITVDVPGRGRKLCWYLWYTVTNPDTEPRNFVPDFELVTLDKPGVFHDQLLPKAFEAIRQVEDPARLLDLKDPVSMAGTMIPPTRPGGPAKRVTGVAIWDDVNPDATRFSIFVSGLSNGWSVTDGPNNQPVLRKKTLQLNFKRLGDRYYQHSGEIRFEGPEQWVYRASSAKVNPEKAPAKAGAP